MILLYIFLQNSYNRIYDLSVKSKLYHPYHLSFLISLGGNMKNILLIATGGTIASTLQSNGFAPTFDATQLLSFSPEINQICHVSVTNLMHIDSSNMNPARMEIIANEINQHINEYDGFVIAHGTDTMAYTASALTYMLQYIQKPVVLMGSQLSISAQYTDAKQNISDAFFFVLENKPGIYIVFDGKVLLATRATKTKTQSIDAFTSINFPPIATIKFGRVVYSKESGILLDQNINSLQSCTYQPRIALCNELFVLKLFPGIKEEFFDYINDNYRGLVIESYGIGGIPNDQPNLFSKIEKLTNNGVFVVITTQCLEEGIDMHVYEVGKKVASLPIIYAGDLTREAIIMKLMWAMANYTQFDQIKQFIECPYMGDMNP